MAELLELLNRYSQIINISLFIAIMGWLFRISTTSRTALKDKHDAELAVRDAEKVDLTYKLATATKELNEIRTDIDINKKHSTEVVELIDDILKNNDAKYKKTHKEMSLLLENLQIDGENIDIIENLNKQLSHISIQGHKVQLTMLSSIAHESRSVTSAISHRVQFIQSNWKNKNIERNKIERYLEDILNESSRLRKMNDMVFMADNNRLLHEEKIVNLKDLFDDTLRMIDTKIKEREIKYKVKGLGSLPNIRINVMSFQHVILVMMLNSIDYSETGGIVSISGTKCPDGIEFLFRDFGIGIPESEKDKIFDLGYVGSNAKELKVNSLGLGLFLAKSFAETNGGDLILSNTRKPTEFKLMLPSRIEVKNDSDR